MKSVKSFLGNTVRTVTLVWFVVHFTLTFIYVMPLTPVKTQLQPVLNVAIGVLFSQNWSLFAPQPANNNQSMIVRCIAPHEAAAATSGKVPTDHWQDISMPLWHRLQENRFTAYDRMARPQFGLIRRYTAGHPDLEPWRASCAKGSEESCKIYEERMKEERERTGTQLGRIASAYCREAFPGRAFSHVAVRSREMEPVPWSQRYTKQPEHKDSEVGVFPLDETVALMGIFKSAQN